MAATTASIGAPAWWNAGYTGQGVDVAMIDSGVSRVSGLDGAGKVVYGPDLSLESQAPNLTNLDTYGHGTFMAGLIAGNDGQPGGYRGVAPDARIVSLKVATADGGADVSQVIAGIDWVVQHAHDPGMNIRVINLSYGTNSTQAYGVDPLAFAVEQAWKHGIVVVAAAGNSGYQKGAGSPCLADPAYDPFAIAVGGTDTRGTVTEKDDQMGSYSSAGAASCKSPDFVAPGSHMQGLRDPNSWIDVNHPEGALDAHYFRGSGTSEATAFVSGAAALVLQKYPNLTPDQVKAYFAANALGLSATIGFQQGKGEIQLEQMLKKGPGGTSAQKFTNSTGDGSLELSRGQDHISQDGVLLTSDQDIFGQSVDASHLAAAEGSGSSWSGGSWNGSSWSGSSWSGSSWSGSSWSGSSWSGSSWSSSNWSSNTWTGSSWSGSSWSGSSWSGSSWSGNTWASAGWY
ncbi:MAG TPA: S8 family serine peptidase [Gaiellaceae bacterium]|nr:S8 family serine peptidase [Gaiellaceae bacterium]